MEPFLSEIRIFSFNWAPKGWAQCDGSILPIAQNNALFALLGTQFGGNGTTNFALPDLRGRVPVHFGVSDRNSSSYSTAAIGTAGGAETVTLTPSQMPAHNHLMQASTTAGTIKPLASNVLGSAINKQNDQPSHMYAPFPTTTAVTLANDSISTTGGSVAHENCQPSAVVNFCIALQGLFPSHN